MYHIVCIRLKNNRKIVGTYYSRNSMCNSPCIWHLVWKQQESIPIYQTTTTTASTHFRTFRENVILEGVGLIHPFWNHEFRDPLNSMFYWLQHQCFKKNLGGSRARKFQFLLQNSNYKCSLPNFTKIYPTKNGDNVGICKGAILTSATMPWHWLFFALSRSHALKICLEVMIP